MVIDRMKPLMIFMKLSTNYLTLTSYSGKLGIFILSSAAHNIGPSSSKCLSALLLLTIPVFSSNVAKFDCNCEPKVKLGSKFPNEHSQKNGEDEIIKLVRRPRCDFEQKS